eukprot:COSAG02_NODE_6800_length_3354_cov_6.480184_3_plen_155_part_00
MTWEEVVDTLGVNDQELYLKWIRIYFRMGNDNSFKKHGLWFPNPLRRSAKKSSHALDIVFKAGDKFPRPHGKEWENFVEATQPVQFDPAESEMFAEFEHNGVEMMVYIEYKEIVELNAATDGAIGSRGAGDVIEACAAHKQARHTGFRRWGGPT